MLPQSRGAARMFRKFERFQMKPFKFAAQTGSLERLRIPMTGVALVMVRSRASKSLREPSNVATSRQEHFHGNVRR